MAALYKMVVLEELNVHLFEYNVGGLDQDN